MHCIERAWERYAVTLTPRDVFVLEQQIRERRSVLVRKGAADGHAEIHLVRHGSTAMVAAWGQAKQPPHAYQIVTFLPEEEMRGGAQARRFERHKRTELNGGRFRRLKRRG